MRTLLTSLILAGICPQQVAAQEATVEIQWPAERANPAGSLSFVSLRDHAASGEVLLANGKKVEDPELWAAVVVANRKSGFCTASLVGPNVLLTAAHCVDALDSREPSRTISGTLTIGGKTRAISYCAMSAPYAAAPIPDRDVPRSSEDFAVCEVGGDFSEITLETLSSSRVKDRAIVLLSGYGCTKVWVFANQLRSSTEGKRALRVGPAQIEATGMFDASNAKGSYLRSRAEDDEPIVCPGDSGGPVFIGADLNNPGGKRRVVAVNSKVTAVADGGSYDYLSFLAAVSDASFNKLLTDWQAKNPARRKVCGRDLSAGQLGCRE